MKLALALAVAALLVAPAVASANPSIAVSAARVGANVRHTLTLTEQGATQTLTVSLSPAAAITVTGVTPAPPGGQTGPGLATCLGHWIHFHFAYRSGPIPDDVTFTLAPGQTATLTADVGFAHAPWPDESLDADWSIEPTGGQAFDVVSDAPDYTGPFGVPLDFQVVRTGATYVVAGTAAGDVDSGHVQLWAYAPGAKQARRVATVPVRDGEWAVSRFAPSRHGKWELYARYRTATKAYADDVSECGTIVSVK